MGSTLSLFGQQVKTDIFQRTEQYLVKLLEPAGECNTFDVLLHHSPMNNKKTISELPPVGHMLRLYYFVHIHPNLHHPQQSTNLDPINFGWQRKNRPLTPEKFCKRLPVEYTVTCGCKNGRYKCRRM